MTHGTTNITIRMDSELKEKADAFFKDLGMNLSTAFNIFVRQSMRAGKIPFEILASEPNAETLEAIEESMRIAYEPNEKGFTDIDELFESLNNDAN